MKPESGKTGEDARTDLLAEVEKLETVLENSSEEDLAFYWRTRNNLDKSKQNKTRQIIWNECERRYEGVTKVPITVRLPYFHQLNAQLVRAEITDRIKRQPWPDFLKQWHCQRMRIVTTSQPTIENIMVNVNKPWYEHKGCKCKAVEKKLREAGYSGQLPMTDGHILFTGREYTGPNKVALSTCAVNVPMQTAWDLKRAWEKAREHLPSSMQGTQTQWNQRLNLVCKTSGRSSQRDATFPTTRDVYKLRKDLNGLVIGPLDKNKGELWCCCPKLYNRALKAMYCKKTGYEKVDKVTEPQPPPMAHWLVEGLPPGPSAGKHATL